MNENLEGKKKKPVNDNSIFREMVQELGKMTGANNKRPEHMGRPHAEDSESWGPETKPDEKPKE